MKDCLHTNFPKVFYIPSLIVSLLISQPDLKAQITKNKKLSDEQIIRSINESENNGKKIMKYSDSSIVAFPDLAYPLVGKLQTEQDQKILADLKKDRSNEVIKRTIKRLVISAGKDMAYQYGNLIVEYDIPNHDNPNKQHIMYDGSYLLIWRKVKGEWLVEAVFNRYNQN